MTNTSSSGKPSESASASAANSQTSASLANQIAFLQNFVSSPTSEEDATVNLAALLQQLDAADDVAKGVEGKLDNLLDNLEGMLKGLEGAVDAPKGDKEEDGGGDEAESAISPNTETQDTNTKKSE